MPPSLLQFPSSSPSLIQLILLLLLLLLVGAMVFVESREDDACQSVRAVEAVSAPVGLPNMSGLLLSSMSEEQEADSVEERVPVVGPRDSSISFAS